MEDAEEGPMGTPRDIPKNGFEHVFPTRLLYQICVMCFWDLVTVLQTFWNPKLMQNVTNS